MAQGDMAYTGEGNHAGSGEKNDGDGDWRRRRGWSCTWPLRINTPGPPVDSHRGKKAWTRGLSWHPSRLLTPGDALEVSRVDAPRQLRPPPWLLPTTTAGLHPHWLGPRRHAEQEHLPEGQTWSVSPAAMAGVQGRPCVAEPVPLVGSGWGRGGHTLAWGKQKL